MPEFGISQQVAWERHIKTDSDNFLHIFTAKGFKYALAFDDYPSGFSVARDSSVKHLKLANGEEILHISASKDRYIESITGSFMLFQVIHTGDFVKLVDYLEASFDKIQIQWLSNSKNTEVIARDLLKLAETASQNHDSRALYSLNNIVESFVGLGAEDNAFPLRLIDTYIKILVDKEFDYEVYSIDEKGQVADEIYNRLSKEIQGTINIQKYEVANLGETVRLVGAMYARVKGNRTEGITATIVFEDGVIKCPITHFINKDMKKYFIENTYINKNNIEHNMPTMLQDYRLVEGSVHVSDVFLRELGFISY